MRKMFFVIIMIFTTFFGVNAQQLVSYLSPTTIVGTVVNGNFVVSTDFDNIMKSISGVTNLTYTINSTEGNNLLEVRLLKNSIPFLIGFYVDTPNIVAMEGNGDKDPINSCTGNCSDGVSGVLTYCSECEFKYENKKIVGCKCRTMGCCVHSITERAGRKIDKAELASFLSMNVLKSN